MMPQCKEGDQPRKKKETFHNARQPDANTQDVQPILTLPCAPQDTVCYADEFI